MQNRTGPAHGISRRGFLDVTALGLTAGLCTKLNAQPARRVPVGVLLYAVQKELNSDFDGTLRAVAEMGYEGVEFTQYIDWTPARAKEIRRVLDDLHLTCLSTHNEPDVYADRLDHAIELNHILGCRSL